MRKYWNFLLALPLIASAETISLPNPLGGDCGDLGCLGDKIIDAIFTLSIPVVAIMVLIGGFQILTSSGDPEKAKTGRQTILYAVIGFAVVLIAKSVVLIIQDFVQNG